MKRIVLLTALAAMMAAAMALSGVAQAKPITTTKADKACLVEALRTVEQPGFNPSDYPSSAAPRITTLRTASVPMAPTCSVASVVMIL